MAACWCPLPSHPWWYSENILSLWTDHPGRQLMVLRFRLPKSNKIDLQDFKIISLDPQSGSENLWLRKLILQLPISELPPFSASYTHFLCAKVTLEIQNYQPLSKYQPWLFQGPLSLFTGSPQAALPGLPLLRVIRVLALQSVFHTIYPEPANPRFPWRRSESRCCWRSACWRWRRLDSPTGREVTQVMMDFANAKEFTVQW